MILLGFRYVTVYDILSVLLGYNDSVSVVLVCNNIVSATPGSNDFVSVILGNGHP